MKTHIRLLTERYWFRLGVSLCFAITAALFYSNRDFVWMIMCHDQVTEEAGEIEQHVVAIISIPHPYQAGSFHDRCA